MRLWIGLLCTVLATSSALADASQLGEHLGPSPALVVVVCSGTDSDRAAISEWLDQTRWTIVCQGGGESVEAMRLWARDAGHLGTRLMVIDDAATRLWLASDMADGVCVLPGATDRPSRDEVLRVLRPGGVAITPDYQTTKPLQAGTDQWNHPYHGPDNNVVSSDQLARLPGELRFQAEPVFAAMPNQSLFAGGRVYFFTGHIAFHEREEPLLNKLTVLNAYNGLTLWTRPLDPQYVVHNFSKVATDEEIIYAEGDSLLVLDGATGTLKGTYPVPDEIAGSGDTDWKWLAHKDGVLWAAFGPPDGRVAPHRQKRQMGHWPWNIANTQYRTIVENFGSADTLAAFRFPSMKLIWNISEAEPFDVRMLCMEGGRILQLAPEKYIAARDAKTGRQLWRHTPETSSESLQAIGAALKRQGWGIGWATYCCARAHDGVVCVAGPPFKKSVCISMEDGGLLWSSNNESPHPFFLDDSLYVMPRVANPTSVCRRVDPETGEVLDEYDLGVIGSCTRLTVTPTQFYYRPGGGEGRTVYFDITVRELASYEGIVRPGCFDGAVPANGRLYWMPLACDCWQVHGTFCMAPRVPVGAPSELSGPAWAQPESSAPARATDWPMYRADGHATATTSVNIPRSAEVTWQTSLPGQGLTAPIAAQGRVFVGSADGTLWALDQGDGQTLWDVTARAAIVHPPAYWQGRVVVGACDGFLYALDAQSGRLLGSRQVAPEHRWVNILGQLMSAWPLGGGLVIDKDGIAYTAAGSTATDGAIVAAVNIVDGSYRWREDYTLDRKPAPLSFGVQSNVLLHGDKLLVNGGAPVGIVAVDTASGQNAEVVAKLDVGRELFVEPDGTPFCAGPELYSGQWARTTIFKRHQGRAYFQLGSRHLALVAGRLFCAEDHATLDAIVQKMNSDPTAGGNRVVSEPWDVMKVPLPEGVLWSSATDDIRGLAVGADGVIVLREDRVEALSVDGETVWSIAVTAPPVRWGIALVGDHCIVSLTDGQIVALGADK